MIRIHTERVSGMPIGSIAPGYLPLKRAAEWAGVSPRTLRRWIARGLPVYRALERGKVLVRPSDIHRFLTCRREVQPDLNKMVQEVIDGMAGKKTSLTPRQA